MCAFMPRKIGTRLRLVIRSLGFQEPSCDHSFEIDLGSCPDAEPEACDDLLEVRGEANLCLDHQSSAEEFLRAGHVGDAVTRVPGAGSGHGFKVTSTAPSRKVIKDFQKAISRPGYPDDLVTDHGPSSSGSSANG